MLLAVARREASLNFFSSVDLRTQLDKQGPSHNRVVCGLCKSPDVGLIHCKSLPMQHFWWRSRTGTGSPDICFLWRSLAGKQMKQATSQDRAMEVRAHLNTHNSNCSRHHVYLSLVCLQRCCRNSFEASGNSSRVTTRTTDIEVHNGLVRAAKDVGNQLCPQREIKILASKIHFQRSKIVKQGLLIGKAWRTLTQEQLLLHALVVGFVIGCGMCIWISRRICQIQSNAMRGSRVAKALVAHSSVFEPFDMKGANQLKLAIPSIIHGDSLQTKSAKVTVNAQGCQSCNACRLSIAAVPRATSEASTLDFWPTVSIRACTEQPKVRKNTTSHMPATHLRPTIQYCSTSVSIAIDNALPKETPTAVAECDQHCIMCTQVSVSFVGLECHIMLFVAISGGESKRRLQW